MSIEPATLEAARAGDANAFGALVEPYRRELRAHCYRMAGSLHDADDLLQDSLLRAWRGLPSFEGRSSLRTWLYRVTTHACLDALSARQARQLPTDLGPASAADVPPSMNGDALWLEPFPTAEFDDGAPSPEARYNARESVALAFLTALQLLPPKQRAVLLLRDVLGMQASECGELLELSVAAVNSALQRARDTLSTRGAQPADARPADEPSLRTLLTRYVQAWEQGDISVLVALLREDATLAMPPFASWLHGARDIAASLAAMVFTPAARGTYKLVAIEANGLPAFAAYQRDAAGAFQPVAIHVITVRGGGIAAIDAFLDPKLFARFGLPELAA